MDNPGSHTASATKIGERLPDSWLFWAALGAGISYMLPVMMGWQGPTVTAWKGTGVALLAFWCASQISGFDAKVITTVMILGALGDVLLDRDLFIGGAVFAVGHMVALFLYLRNRRAHISTSQALLAVSVVPLAMIIAWSMPTLRSEAWKVVLYTFFVATMAATAWTSRFPRYRTGLGAMMFLASDLFLFSRYGPLEGSPISTLLVWPLYFIGQALIVWGVVDTLRDETA